MYMESCITQRVQSELNSLYYYIECQQHECGIIKATHFVLFCQLAVNKKSCLLMITTSVFNTPSLLMVTSSAKDPVAPRALVSKVHRSLQFEHKTDVSKTPSH